MKGIMKYTNKNIYVLRGIKIFYILCGQSNFFIDNITIFQVAFLESL